MLETGWTESEAKVQARLARRQALHEARLAAAFPNAARPAVLELPDELAEAECRDEIMELQTLRQLAVI